MGLFNIRISSFAKSDYKHFAVGISYFPSLWGRFLGREYLEHHAHITSQTFCGNLCVCLQLLKKLTFLGLVQYPSG